MQLKLGEANKALLNLQLSAAPMTLLGVPTNGVAGLSANEKRDLSTPFSSLGELDLRTECLVRGHGVDVEAEWFDNA